MIFTGFLPNAEKKDIVKAINYLFNPFKWKKLITGKDYQIALDKFKKYFNSEDIYFFDSGRSALQIALESLNLPCGSEILVQSYTCVVVTNAIIWAGFKPVFVDIDKNYNIDILDLRKKISKKTKAIIIQHTFGKAADLNEILTIAKQNDLKTIEDCAHSLGGIKNEKKLGTFADLAMFSFGSDKIISCVRGGALLVNNRNYKEKIAEKNKNLAKANLIKTIQYLANFLLFPIGKKLYRIKIGKFILATAKRFSLTGRIIFDSEKKALPNKFYPAQLANSLADILSNQIDKIDDFNIHRKKIANFYFENIKNKNILAPFDSDCVYLRFPLQVNNPELILKQARKKGIILGDWYNSVIAPKDIDISKTFYISNSCPNAEKTAKCSLNLPTDKNIDFKKAKKIVDFINKYGS
ncbi:MAG: DegT/DnrJ/EryC1/StrS aminotransferase family protein [Patescibacteria group bacterium]